MTLIKVHEKLKLLDIFQDNDAGYVHGIPVYVTGFILKSAFPRVSEY